MRKRQDFCTPVNTGKKEKNNKKIEILYLLYREKLFHYAQKILQNPEDAEDAVQQCFAWLIEKDKKIEDPQSEAVWHYLSVITKHFAINRIREKTRYYNELPAELEQNPFRYIEPGPTPLDEAMDMLSDRSRDMLLLRFSDGWTSQEIADLYEMKVSAVRQALLRAKRELRTILLRKGVDNEENIK